MRCWWQMRNARATSSVVSGYTTPSGGWAGRWPSSRPCCSRTDEPLEKRLANAASNSGEASEKLLDTVCIDSAKIGAAQEVRLSATTLHRSKLTAIQPAGKYQRHHLLNYNISMLSPGG